MRTYEGKIKLPPVNQKSGIKIVKSETKPGRYDIVRTDFSIRKRSMTGIRRGLKIVHIGDDVWRIGRAKEIKDRGLHQVIYSPQGKEYHLWNDEVEELSSYYDDYYDNGNHVDEAKVKIYILTHILDEEKNWCFDLKIIPNLRKLKVIYSNGKVMNIEFNGEFLSYDKEKRIFIKTPPFDDLRNYDYGTYYVIDPVGYRIN